MASIHKRKESKFWWGSFWHEKKGFSGQPGRRTAGAASGYRLGGGGEGRRGDSLTGAKSHGRPSGENAGKGQTRISCGDYLKRWTDVVEGTVDGGTLTFYKGAAGAFVKHVGDKRMLDAITKEDVVAWRTAEKNRVAGRTVNNRIKVVRAMFRAAIEDGFALKNPAGT